MNRSGFFNQSSVVKKSPVVIVKNFIMLQLAAVAAFFLVGILADYGEIYDNLPFSRSLSFHIAQAMGIFLLETGLVFYIFFYWYKEYYDIKPDKIIHGRGIFFRQKTVIPLKPVYSVSYRQGPVGKLTKYGAIDLRDGISGQTVVIDHIPEPQKYAELIIQLKDNLISRESDRGLLTFEDLLLKDEHERLEFKESFRWDFRQNKVNKNLEKAVMKTITAFLNSEGGQLLIGVDDSGHVVGLEQDYKSLPKPSADGFQNHFTNVFHAMIGPEFRQFTELMIQKVDGKECGLVKVMPAGKPAYLRADNQEELYIRTGNGTTALKVSEAASYIDSRWKGTLL